MSDLRYLRYDGTKGVLWPLRNGVIPHVLTREDRVKGGRVRAARAREGRDSLRYERRGSQRLEEAAERLGEMLRSDNPATAEWADAVIKRHILPERSKHVPSPYLTSTRLTAERTRAIWRPSGDHTGLANETSPLPPRSIRSTRLKSGVALISSRPAAHAIRLPSGDQARSIGQCAGARRRASTGLVTGRDSNRVR